MKRKLWSLAGALALALVPCIGTAQTDVYHQQWTKDLKGKTIAYVPVASGLALTDIWGQTMADYAEHAGMKFTTHDPGFDTQREVQILTSLIAQHPDVIIAHNPDVQSLANVLKRAVEAGIYVIQVNMGSKFPSAAFVGVDPVELGTKMATAVVNACGGPSARSHKIALMNGVVTSAYSLGIMQGAKAVFDQHKDITIVSDQAANWTSKIAHDKAATVLQAHSDLCAYMGWWSGQDQGIAQAAEQAGLQGKVKVFTTGGGEPPACDYIRDGKFYETFSYQAEKQAIQMVTLAEFLLQSGIKPGNVHTTIYTPIVSYTKDNITPTACTKVKKAKS